MSILSDEIKIKTAVGLLLTRADELTKRVLTAFDPSAKRPANMKALNSFNLDILERISLALICPILKKTSFLLRSHLSTGSYLE